MDQTVAKSTFDEIYAADLPGWVIGEPQPAVVELERQGRIRGAVLDPGCGLGEHTIHLAKLGYDVLGIDSAARAIELAERNAADKGVPARFAVADALRLGRDHSYDTIVDSALFHVFGAADRHAYAKSLHAVCRPDGQVFVLALAETDERGFGPRIRAEVIEEAFQDGWELTDIEPSHYYAMAYDEQAAELGVASGTRVALPAWLASARRV
ncbi:methyltransferase family protein [Tamaricihabitans halophyticus]|uniref:Methyltransferase family protein n=1 Tax=Tamaricihabitans halophyticus TaxID=1262583 RepID=A0A4R2QX39_9PSEU|nr:class I SAM-dependent methyltransferase [Tamaricihabitans halophyticus]TCP53538.1 methyltransferase family protein [Tamaricihabitans halophyticus]